jgi:hypothetical protein
MQRAAADSARMGLDVVKILREIIIDLLLILAFIAAAVLLLPGSVWSGWKDEEWY